MAGTRGRRRTYERWAEMKQRDLSDPKAAYFQRNPKLEAFQYPEAGTYERERHSRTTGALPLFMLSHFNCPANDPRCKVTVVFCASLWHYFLYYAYTYAQEKNFLTGVDKMSDLISGLPSFLKLSYYAVALFVFAMFSIITMDCSLFIFKYVFYDSAVYLKDVLSYATSGLRAMYPANMAQLRRPAFSSLNTGTGPKYSEVGGNPQSPHFLLESMSAAGTLNRTPYEMNHRFRQLSVSG